MVHPFWGGQLLALLSLIMHANMEDPNEVQISWSPKPETLSFPKSNP